MRFDFDKYITVDSSHPFAGDKKSTNIDVDILPVFRTTYSTYYYKTLELYFSWLIFRCVITIEWNDLPKTVMSVDLLNDVRRKSLSTYRVPLSSMMKPIGDGVALNSMAHPGTETEQ